MGSKVIRKQKRRILAKVKRAPLMPVVVLGILVASFVIMDNSKRFSVIPSSYRPLLNLIADVESRGNYNAYFGSPNNSSIDFTKMSVAEVMQWQKDHAASGALSTAVGRYQIIDTTLSGLVNRLALDPNQKFDSTMQDRLAIALLERRGATEYVNNQIDEQQFAAELAKEWAALPRVVGDRPEQSYYAGDGLNKALVKVDEVLRAVGGVSAKAV